MLSKKYKNSLIDFLDHYPISTQKAFEIAKVHRRTFQRWLDGESSPPDAVMDLLRIVALGEPPDHAFKGWRFSQGKLYSPFNYKRGFEPAEIIQIPDFYRDRHRLRDIESHFTLQSKLF